MGLIVRIAKSIAPNAYRAMRDSLILQRRLRISRLRLTFGARIVVALQRTSSQSRALRFGVFSTKFPTIFCHAIPPRRDGSRWTRLRVKERTTSAGIFWFAVRTEVYWRL